MICTSVILCLSSDLSKNDRVMSMFVLFPGFFGFYSKIGDKHYTKAIKHDILVNF